MSTAVTLHRDAQGPAVRVQASPIAVHADPDPGRWNAYVSRHPEASAYHLYGWRNVIARAFGHETRYLTAEVATGVAGVLPLVVFRSRLFGRFVVSMPFLNYGGVLADSPKVEAALLEAAIAETTRAGGSHLELRHTRQLFPQLQAKRHKVAMVMALQPSVEEQWNALDRKLRNQVRKAEKSCLRVVRGGAELLDDFYTVFARNMRDLGTPVYGARWFREVLAAFPDTTRLFVVYSGTRAVAASLVHWRGATMEVPWASALREFNPLCPNVLLYWDMVKFGIEQGFSHFDLGRSTPDEGTYHFKRQWAAEPVELVWEYWTPAGHPLPDLSPKNPKFDRAIAAWRRLPVRLTTLLGPRIVRNIP
ncbi:MAG: FemAB family PEP-CTERM system-associated protein [Acidobacteria bacterium]|nr:FemAB family PEP-CTERM system-associated protein [Acidobacteriota bacterium]